MAKLTGVIKNYDWGSKTILASWLGKEASSLPEAELWFGTHPLGTATFVDGTLLSAHLQADPTATLGREIADNYGNDIPFLFKILAVNSLLSIQVHPDAATAKKGFELENSKNIPLDDFYRSYKDRNPKPEMVVALSDFSLFAGFKPYAQIKQLFIVNGLADFFPSLKCNLTDDTEGLKLLVGEIFTLKQEQIEDLISVVKNELTLAIAAGEKTIFEIPVEILTKVSAKFPQDLGVLLLLTMRFITLKIGESISVPAGIVHAYVEGFAAEIMVNSDNVLRGGLTSKNIDKPEFLKNLVYDANSDLQVIPTEKDNISTYNPGIPEFTLNKLVLNKEQEIILPEETPVLLVLLSGQVIIDGQHLKVGDGYWIDQTLVASTVIYATETSELFYATVPAK